MASCNARAANVANTSQRRRICSANTPGPANEYTFIAATVEPSTTNGRLNDDRHPAAWASSAPPAGFEPATRGLGNLCSIP